MITSTRTRTIFIIRSRRRRRRRRIRTASVSKPAPGASVLEEEEEEEEEEGEFICVSSCMPAVSIKTLHTSAAAGQTIWNSSLQFLQIQVTPFLYSSCFSSCSST